MGLLTKIKDKIKNFLKDPETIGKKKTTFDYLVDEVGRQVNKVRNFGTKLQQDELEYYRQKGLSDGDAKARVMANNIDPLLGTGAVGKQTGRILKQAAQRGVAKQVAKKILQMGESTFQPVKNAVGRLGIPSKQVVSNNFTNYLKNQNEYITSSAVKRNEIMYKNFTGENPNEIVKIRKKGDGSVKITKGELDIMENMQDLKKSAGDYYIQNPIRIFEQLGDEAKELFYRPVKVAEGLTVKSKNFWNSELKKVTKGLKSKSSENIMKYAVSLERGGDEILKTAGKTIEKLTDQEMKAYKFMRFRYNRMINQLNEARAIVGKTPIKKRKNYFTHIKDLNVLEDMGFSSVSDDIETLLANKVHRNQTAFQFAKKRTGSLQDIEWDAINVFSKYQEKAVENIKLTPAIAKLRELTRTKILNPTTGKTFNLQESHPRAFKEIQQWIDFVAGQKPETRMPKVMETLLGKLNQNVAFATLSFNVRSAVIQPSAIINSITEIGVKNVGRGIKELMFGGGDFALKNSNVLNGRQFETAIKDIANNFYGKTGRVKKAVGEIGIKPLQILDSLTAQATWLGAFNEAKTKLGYATEKAINYADDVVTKTQASAARSDVAKIQRTTGGKVLTQFQTFVINDFNRLVKDVFGIGVKDMSKSNIIKKATTYLTAVSLWNYVTEDVLGIPTPIPRPIKATKEGGIKEGAKELASNIPIVGGGFRFSSSPYGAIADLLSQSSQKISGKYTSQSWWEIAGKLIGVPGVSQLKRLIKGIDGLEDGFSITYNKRDSSGNLVKSKKTGKVITKRIEIKLTDPIEKIRSLLFGIYETKEAKSLKTTGKKVINNK